MTNYFPKGFVKDIISFDIGFFFRSLVELIDFKHLMFYISILGGFVFYNTIKSIGLNVYIVLFGTLIITSIIEAIIRKGSVEAIFDETFHLSVAKWTKIFLIYLVLNQFVIKLNITDIIYATIVAGSIYMIWWYTFEKSMATQFINQLMRGKR
tara:strand:- start:1371 stop:1829 length:459 start_codon:yes stop_codon:yes gene_type:complete